VLDQLILLLCERAWQIAFSSGDIIRDEQMGQGWKVMGPGELFQHAAQVNHVPGATNGTSRRVARSEEGQPAEDVWITP